MSRFPAVFSLFLLFAVPLPARSGCGALECAADAARLGALRRREIRLGWEFEFNEQDRPRVATSRAAVGQVRGHHNEVHTVSRAQRLGLEATFGERFGLKAALPFVSRSHLHVHRHQGRDLSEVWSLSGLGDVSLEGRWALWRGERGARAFSLSAGVEAPTGEDHAANAQGDEAEPGVTPGNGAWDVSAGAALSGEAPASDILGLPASRPWFLSASLKVHGEGREGYRLGDVLRLGAGLLQPLNGGLGIMLQGHYEIKGRDRKGSTGEETQKTGGETLYASPGLRWDAGGGWELFALFQWPLYQRVNQIQLVAPYLLKTGLAKRWSW